MIHVPVLLQEVIKCLNPESGKNFVDATCGEGGYTQRILDLILPQGKVLAIDWNADAIKEIKKNIVSENLVTRCGNFREIDNLILDSGLREIDGVVYDLGLSKFLLEKSERGFSFKKDEPLVMSFSKDSKTTAEKILNHESVEELEKIFLDYGEEKFAKRIARAVIKARPISTSKQLAELVEDVIGRRGKTHPATKVFQALRIAVNDELLNLKLSLSKAIKLIGVGGRIVVVSYHSLEDRIVKNIFKDAEKTGLVKILTKKPIQPSEEEKGVNPSARSAKLRAVEKV